MIIMLYLGLLFLLVTISYYAYSTQKKSKNLQLKTEELYHDINSCLVIFKLTTEGLQDISSGLHNSTLSSLVHALNETINKIEKSFRSWDL